MSLRLALAVPRSGRRLRLYLFAAVVGAVATSITFMLMSRPQESTMRFGISLPVLAREMALSRDGHWMVVVAPDESTGRSTLYVHQIGAADVRKLAETEGASYPFWSPDGKQIGFFADGHLKKIAASGGSPTELAEVGTPRGGSWGSKGVIIFTPDTGSEIWKISEEGGKAERLTKFDSAKNDTSHRDSDTNGSYVDPGYLVFGRGHNLMAQRFDSKSLHTLAPPFAIASDVQIIAEISRADFTAAENGTLVMSTSLVPRETQLTWFDRNGKRLGTVGSAELQSNPTLSPNGARLAVDSADQITKNVDIIVHDLKQGTQMRASFSPAEDSSPVWQPDGAAIYYRTFDAHPRIVRADLNGSATHDIAQIPGANDLMPTSVSAHGDIAFADFNNQNGSWKIVTISLPKGELKDVLVNARTGMISPDGKWVAYSSRQSGTNEIYVTSFPGAQGKWQVSQGGGSEPRWRRDSKEIFFLAPHNMLMATPVNARETLSVGSPAALFTAPAREPISSTDIFNYDVSSDGQRFLVNKPVEASSAPPLRLILNWTAELKK